ncbi:MAG TPA: lipopolysaccharide kinase InaA family protein [Candidatus Binataceae bacterium]|nr:lipopolysaccharide kinase InaA family protein [Candidatus Binataceae bacterium]
MSRVIGEHVDRAGWRFLFPESARELSSDARAQLIDTVVAAVSGKCGAPFRRSRHATTWKVPIANREGESARVFIKQIDPGVGPIAKAKAILRATRSEHVVAISEALRRDSFGVSRVVLIGENLDTGHQVIVANEVPGFMLTRWMNPAHSTSLAIRRAILHQLGEEIARLHRVGYIHGDLTPYNIFVTIEPSIAITFIDHERTIRISRLTINLARNRMRNLVQLGHFNIPGISRADKLRVFNSYSAAAGWSDRGKRKSLSRLTKMIRRRLRANRAPARDQTRSAIIAQGPVRG